MNYFSGNSINTMKLPRRTTPARSAAHITTIQVDYNLPERFKLEYTGSDNQKHRPVMIHRAPFGSMERFIAVLIEHCAGNFPLWLTPVQMVIIPISDKFNDYADSILVKLKNNNIRAQIDNRSEKMGAKIRTAEINKIPIMIILGEQEVNSKTISVRRKFKGNLGTLTIDDFIVSVKKEISNRSI